MASRPSWGWTTGERVGLNPSGFVGYTFDPNDFYNEGSIRDGDEDGRVSPRDSGGFHPNDGWAFDREVYNVSRNWTFEATVTYTNGDTATVKITGARLVDKHNDSTAPLHGTMMFRFQDNTMYAVADGGIDDGNGKYIYAMKDIASIKMTKLLSKDTWRNPDNNDDFWPKVVCFTTGTLIKTASGQVPIEVLKVGDSACTADSGYQKIRWIGATKIAAADFIQNPKLLPVRIKARALGQHLPERDLVVSRQHRILVRSKIVQRVFGVMEALVPAIKLVGCPGIEVVEDVENVIYWHILLDRHEVIFAEGAPTESLFAGPQALKCVSLEAQQEIETLFPELVEPDFAAKPARLIPAKGSAIRQFVERHKKNGKPLLGEASYGQKLVTLDQAAV